MQAIDNLPQFVDSGGIPLNNGKLYFGVAGQNPEVHPIDVYWDEAGTDLAPQPIRTTAGGYPSRYGRPSRLYSSTVFSLTVRTASNALVYSDLSASPVDTEGVAPFFEWNGINLNQFGTLQDGSSSASAPPAVVTVGGVSWIRISVTGTGATHWSEAASFLPALTAPPSPNYLVRADVILETIVANYCTAGIGVRNVAGSNIGSMYYLAIVRDLGTSGTVLLGRVDDSPELATGAHSFTTGESIAGGEKGHPLILGVQGGVQLNARCCNDIVATPSGTLLSAAGSFGIIAGGNGPGANGYTALFRNIRAYAWPDSRLVF